jgi:methylated-DNA-protein-cysteine methyltransferase-like protein
MDDDAHRILAAVHAIPRGEVAAYGEIARRAGLPRRARLVARVLSQHTDPTLPWHRVVRADGRIAFPVGSDGFHEQRRRLADEGVVVGGGGGGRPPREDDLDAALWAPPL